MFDYSNLLASRKMTLLPSVRVRISPSLVISSLPTIWSVMMKLLISTPVTVSQTRSVLSSLKLTNCLLPGVYITCLMPPMRPSNLMIGSLGCSRSNILTTNHNIYYLFPQNITKLPGNLIVTTAPVHWREQRSWLHVYVRCFKQDNSNFFVWSESVNSSSATSLILIFSMLVWLSENINTASLWLTWIQQLHLNFSQQLYTFHNNFPWFFWLFLEINLGWK